MRSSVRPSSSSEHNPSWAQLTCDRKYETVESAELPEIQLFVIDPPNSTPCSAFQSVLSKFITFTFEGRMLQQTK